MIRLSLGFRIAVTVFILTGAMAALLLWYTQKMQLEAEAAQQAASEAVIADLLGEFSRFAIIKSEYSDLENHLARIRRNSRVRKIVVADAAGRVVASTDGALLGLALPLLRDGDASSWKTQELANAAGPQGLLAIEFSNSELRAAQQRIRARAAVLALAGMALIALVSVLMAAALTRRLAILDRASRRIGEGDFGARTHMTGSDEVSMLGQTLDAMAGKIQAAMDELRSSERRFTGAFEHAPIGMALVGLDGRFLQVNQALCRILGHPREKLLTMAVADVTHPDDRPAEEARKADLRAGGGPGFAMVERYLHADGHVVWGQLSVSVVEDGQGRPQYFVGQLEDITERKQASEALQASREQYRLVVENAGEGIFIAQDGRIKFPNAALLSLLECTPEELGSQPFTTFIHPGDRQLVLDRHRRRLLGEDLPATYGFRVVTTSGATRWVHLSTVKIEWEGGPATLNFLRDTTQQKGLELQLMHAQKMEAVGQLAGGIAHDFNNMLSAILGYGEVALAELPADAPVRDDVAQILTAAKRGADLTRSLLAFSRKQVIHPRPLTVDAIVGRVQHLLRRVIGEDIALHTALAAPEETVLADSGQIEQLLMNLATNSRDAMPRGGRLTIETRRTQIDDDFIRRHGYGKAGAYVLLSVSDTGAGMDEATRQRVFEPFFTTKEVGKGTGLGLAMVYGSVKQHGGYISVDSEPGKGSTFRIYLPLVSAAPVPLAVAGSLAAPRSGKETVLLAEDDPAVRSLTSRVLGESGYTVIVASDGQDALAHLARNLDRIDLLIVDVVMPGMNGKEVAEEAEGMKPGIKVLYTSGYPADVIQTKGVLQEGLSFIAKPAAPQDLLRKVREVLDR